MQSDLYDIVERHTVVFTLKTAGSAKPTIDPKTETAVFAPGAAAQTVTLEVALYPAGQGGQPNERAGLDLSDGRRIMQIVGTEGAEPLKLPDGVSAGDKAEVTLLGQKGTIQIQALSPAQIPEVSDDQGWLYSVLWEAVKRG